MLWNFENFGTILVAPIFWWLIKKWEGVELKISTIIYIMLTYPRFWPKSWKSWKSWVTFSGFFPTTHQRIYIILLINNNNNNNIHKKAFSWIPERPLLKMKKTKYFLFWGGPPLQVFRISPKSGLNHWYHYRINLKSGFRFTQVFQDFYQEKKT